KRTGRGRSVLVVDLLGRASYCLYLVHPLVGGLIMRGIPRGLDGYARFSVLALGLILAVCLSVALYWFFERPTTKATRRLLLDAVARVHPRSADAELSKPGA